MSDFRFLISAYPRLELVGGPPCCSVGERTQDRGRTAPSPPGRDHFPFPSYRLSIIDCRYPVPSLSVALFRLPIPDRPGHSQFLASPLIVALENVPSGRRAPVSPDGGSAQLSTPTGMPPGLRPNTEARRPRAGSAATRAQRCPRWGSARPGTRGLQKKAPLVPHGRPSPRGVGGEGHGAGLAGVGHRRPPPLPLGRDQFPSPGYRLSIVDYHMPGQSPRVLRVRT